VVSREPLARTSAVQFSETSGAVGPSLVRAEAPADEADQASVQHQLVSQAGERSMDDQIRRSGPERASGQQPRTERHRLRNISEYARGRLEALK
jgi:hypothetical protein